MSAADAAPFYPRTVVASVGAEAGLLHVAVFDGGDWDRFLDGREPLAHLTGGDRTLAEVAAALDNVTAGCDQTWPDSAELRRILADFAANTPESVAGAGLPAVTSCVGCGTPTDAVCGYCATCVDAATRASCAEQGVPVFPTDPNVIRELSRAFSTPPAEPLDRAVDARRRDAHKTAASSHPGAVGPATDPLPSRGTPADSEAVTA